MRMPPEEFELLVVKPGCFKLSDLLLVDKLRILVMLPRVLLAPDEAEIAVVAGETKLLMLLTPDDEADDDDFESEGISFALLGVTEPCLVLASSIATTVSCDTLSKLAASISVSPSFEKKCSILDGDKATPLLVRSLPNGESVLPKTPDGVDGTFIGSVGGGDGDTGGGDVDGGGGKASSGDAGDLEKGSGEGVVPLGQGLFAEDERKSSLKQDTFDLIEAPEIGLLFLLTVVAPVALFRPPLLPSTISAF